MCPRSGLAIGPHHTALWLCICQCVDPIPTSPTPRGSSPSGTHAHMASHRAATQAVTPKVLYKGTKINKAFEVRKLPPFLGEALGHQTHFAKHPIMQLASEDGWRLWGGWVNASRCSQCSTDLSSTWATSPVAFSHPPLPMRAAAFISLSCFCPFLSTASCFRLQACSCLLCAPKQKTPWTTTLLQLFTPLVVQC